MKRQSVNAVHCMFQSSELFHQSCWTYSGGKEKLRPDAHAGGTDDISKKSRFSAYQCP